MLIKFDIENLVIEAIKKAQKEGIFPLFEMEKDGLPGQGKSIVVIDHPAEKIHGDYSTNIGLRLASILKKDPCEIATQIGDLLLAQKSDRVLKVEVVHPGFLNIFLSEKFIQNEVKNILKQKDKYGSLKINIPAPQKKVLLEFLSINPTGDLHLGHGRGAFWGDVLANVLEKAGYNIKREYYVNNAKSSNQIRELGKTALGQGETYLTENLKLKIEAKNSKLKILAKKIKDNDNLYGGAGFLMAKELIKDIQKLCKKDLKINFDIWFSEEDELYKKNKVKKTYDWLKSNDFIYEKEGAEWLKLSQFGDSEDRVIVRSDNNRTPTYLLPDIAYHNDKIKRGFNRLINIWGADHQGHVKSIKAALKIMGFDGQFDILITQMVSMKDGDQTVKFSKRLGNIVTLKSLIDEVGLDSVRFFYLMKSLDTQMELDLALMKERSSKNPVFYVQYAHARICSILRKTKNLKLKTKDKRVHLEILSTESELDLMKELLKLPELIEEISNDYQVHKLTHYAVSLADKFHHFYHECRVITEDELLTGARLALIEATKITLKNTLDLLGVNAPNKM